MPKRRPTPRRFLSVLLAACAGLAGCVTSQGKSNADALWTIVHDYCEPAARGADVAQKCVAVNVTGGYAVLKDINGIAQYLLIPTRHVTGIESPALLETDAPNYWRAAWEARRFVDASLAIGASLSGTLPRDEMSLAVNSASGRTQNQLHIHVDCLAPDVVRALRQYGPAIGAGWSRFPVLLRGHAYDARRIDDASLSSTDPFRLLAARVAQEGQTMGDQTLLLAGATLPDGTAAFYLLNDHVQPGNAASAEELQDHTCAVTRR
jgi:CDP-diacylglycerol pyrophosphatase